MKYTSYNGFGRYDEEYGDYTDVNIVVININLSTYYIICKNGLKYVRQVVDRCNTNFKFFVKPFFLTVLFLVQKLIRNGVFI